MSKTLSADTTSAIEPHVRGTSRSTPSARSGPARREQHAARSGRRLPSDPFVPGMVLGVTRPSIMPTDLGFAPDAQPTRATPQFGVVDVVRTEKVPGDRTITWSALETAGITMLACEPSVTQIRPYGHVLRFASALAAGGGLRDVVFRPDAVARLGDGRIVAYAFGQEWAKHARGAEPKRAEREIRAAYRTLGVGFRVLSERILFARRVRENRVHMLRARAGRNHPHLDTVRRALTAWASPSTVEAIHRACPLRRQGVAATLACVLELALAGEVALDLSNPIGPRTRVALKEAA